MNTTQSKIKNYQEYIEKEEKNKTRLEKLIAALKDYDKKTIDKRFFEKYFAIPTENGLPRYNGLVWTEFDLRRNEQGYGNYSHYISIDRYEKVEIVDNNKNREYILGNAINLLHNINERIANYTTAIEKLSTFNESALLEDLKALYFKHGCPSTWDEVLKSWDARESTLKGE